MFKVNWMHRNFKGVKQLLSLKVIYYSPLFSNGTTRGLPPSLLLDMLSPFPATLDHSTHFPKLILLSHIVSLLYFLVFSSHGHKLLFFFFFFWVIQLLFIETKHSLQKKTQNKPVKGNLPKSNCGVMGPNYTIGSWTLAESMSSPRMTEW